LGAESE